MKNILLATTLLSTSLLTQNVSADVNMKDASYYKTWVDLEITKDQRVFQLRRTYNSRSLHQGLFGFGWCSDIEKNLDLNRSDQISLNDCRLTAPIRYKKKKNNYYETDSLDPQKETLEFKDNIYIRTTAKKTQQKYSKNGKLLSLFDTTKDRIDITYEPNSGFIKTILVNQRTELKITPDLFRKHIQSVTSKNLPGAYYRYENKDLVEVKNSWQNKFYYTYDTVHNLTEVRYPDKTQELLTYDKEKDWILQIRDRSHCLEIFKYTKQTSSNYTSTAEKRCAGKVTTKTSYEFRHKARADGSKYLDQVKFTQGSKIQKISYQNQMGPLNESQ
jgi:hypothetical protein